MADGASRTPVVALINTTPDVVDMLRIAFEQAGFVAVSTFTHMIRDGELDIHAFMRQHRPDAIVYDIAPPYKSNWQLFQHVIQSPGVAECPVVLTSTNPERVRQLAGTTDPVFEVVETPYEIMKLIDAVTRVVKRPE
jgi:CheY-like chemotaxis protein